MFSFSEICNSCVETFGASLTSLIEIITSVVVAFCSISPAGLSFASITKVKDGIVSKSIALLFATVIVLSLRTKALFVFPNLIE